MTQEDKKLLLMDLCTRLPYSTKIEVVENEYFCSIEELDCYYLDRVGNNFYKIKPYLFPLSNMTEEQKEEYLDLVENQYRIDANGNIFTLQDFYCKYHIDYRNLISKNLAIDANNLNIY